MTSSRGLDLLRENLPPATLRLMAKRALWQRGDLSYLILSGGQRLVYDFIRAERAKNPNLAAPFVANCHRGMGKTFLEVILAFEELFKRPATGLIIGPTERQALEITEPAFLFILESCPPDLRPVSSDGGRVWTVRNPAWGDPSLFSKLRVVGAKERASHLRGFRANFIAVDEVGYFDDPRYVTRDVLVPIFAGRTDPLFLASSTPPEVATHYFCSEMIPAAQADGRYILLRASDNPAFTPADEERYLSVYRTKDSAAWRREFDCSTESDPSALAIPSFTFHQAELVAEHPRPAYCFTFLSGDMGFVDCAAFLWAHIDFGRGKLVIEDELVRSSLGTRALSDKIKEKDALLYGTKLDDQTPNPPPNRRIFADATPRELDDLRGYGIHASSAKAGAERWDKWSGLARLETLCADRKLEIHPRCRSLIFQLLSATKNKNHTDLARVEQTLLDPLSPIAGHFDAVWALAYLAWQARSWWLASPYPSTYVPPSSHRGIHTVVSSNSERSGIKDVPLVIGDCSGHIR